MIRTRITSGRLTGMVTPQTAAVTGDLYAARNTLTHRIQGPTSTATIELDHGAMRDGDRAGLAMLRQSSAWLGVKRDNGTTRVVLTNGLSMDGNWNTTSTGAEVASAAVSGGRIWLRANADIRPGSGRQAPLRHAVPRRRGDRTPLRPHHAIARSSDVVIDQTTPGTEGGGSPPGAVTASPTPC